MLTYATILCHPAPTATPVQTWYLVMNLTTYFPFYLGPSHSIGDLENIERHWQEREALPESTGCTLFKSIEKESSGDRSATVSITSWLSVKMYATRPLRKRKMINSAHPIKSDVKTATLIANFAAFALPRPSSFDTLTLNIFPTKLSLFSTNINLPKKREIVK